MKVYPNSACREVDHLLVRSGADLPNICVLSGVNLEDTGGRMETLHMDWIPPEARVLFSVGGLTGAVAGLTMRQQGTLYYRVSAAMARRITARRWVGGIALVLSLGAMMKGAGMWPAWGLFVTGFIGSLASAIVLKPPTRLRVVGYSNGWFRVKGCSPEFLRALPSARWGQSP